MQPFPECFPPLFLNVMRSVDWKSRTRAQFSHHLRLFNDLESSAQVPMWVEGSEHPYATPPPSPPPRILPFNPCPPSIILFFSDVCLQMRAEVPQKGSSVSAVMKGREAGSSAHAELLASLSASRQPSPAPTASAPPTRIQRAP